MRPGRGQPPLHAPRVILIISFAPEAREELFEVADYYESESPGLGVSFLAAVDRALEQPRPASSGERPQ
jgi:hypothetical protein